MAIKVVENGTRRQIRCSKCNALLSYRMDEDVILEPVGDFYLGEGLENSSSVLYATRKLY